MIQSPVRRQWFFVPDLYGGTPVMSLTPALQTPAGRRAFVRSVISAFERDEPIGSDVAIDEHGLLAATFTAKPDRRLYYVERLDPTATDGCRCLVVRPNRSRHLTQDPMELARGNPYESRVSPKASVYGLPTEPFRSLRDLRAVRRHVLEHVGHNPRPLVTQQVRSDRQLGRLYRRLFVAPRAGTEDT